MFKRFQIFSLINIVIKFIFVQIVTKAYSVKIKKMNTENLRTLIHIVKKSYKIDENKKRHKLRNKNKTKTKRVNIKKTNYILTAQNYQKNNIKKPN